MSLSLRVSEALTRVGVEFKSMRQAVESKYTKPASGIPLGDLSTAVQANLAPLSVPGEPNTNILGGVKNPAGNATANKEGVSYIYSTIGVDSEGEMSSGIVQLLFKAFMVFLEGSDPDGDPVEDTQLIGSNGLNQETKKMLKAALRWEQEILVQSGTRVAGYGPARRGIHVPYGIRIKGIRYEFETVTEGSSSSATFMVNDTAQPSAAMNMPRLEQVNIVTGLDIPVAAGSRLQLNLVNAGTGVIGKGLYMSMWGEYDLDGVFT